MGNKSSSSKTPGKPTNYRVEIEFFGDKVVAG